MSIRADIRVGRFDPAFASESTWRPVRERCAEKGKGSTDMITKASAWKWDPISWLVFIGAFATTPAGALFERWFPPAVAGGVFLLEK